MGWAQRALFGRRHPNALKEDPIDMIERAFHAYTKAVETKFKASRRPPTTKRGLVELRNKARHLCDLVDQLEDGPEFSALVEKTRSAFHGDWHSARGASWWRDPIRNFFCRTGYYTDTFAGSDAPCALFERYEAAFQRRSVHTKYMAPLEFVNFPKSELKFSGFEIRKFDRKELEEIVGNDVNRVLYPYAFFHNETLAALQEYWFIVVRIPEEARRLGRIYSSAAVAAAVKGRVFLEYTRFPPAIERVLARLVLFDWVGDPQDPLTYSGQDGLPFGFEIPFVLRVDDNDLKGPESAPDLSKLKSYGTKVNPVTEEEYEAPYVTFNLNEPRVAALEEYIQRADECLRNLEKKKHDTKLPYLETLDTRWPFLKVAIGNLIKAFFTEGLDQLLWHITALEALLGERGPGVTASLAKRIAAILGTTEEEKEKRRKQFKELYQLRCDLVHGNQFKKDTHRQQLFEARMMALRVTIWFVHYLGEMAARVKEESWQGEVLKREDFLALLDLSNADRDRLKAEVSSRHECLLDWGDSDRDRLSALLSNLPNGFPAAPTWSP